MALVIIAFAGLTYLLVVKTLNRQTDENLSDMARNFKAAVDSELDDESDKSSVEQEISEDVAELRFHDFTLFSNFRRGFAPNFYDRRR